MRSALNIYSKLTLFDPSAITEIDYGVGRHDAGPTGRVIAPANDELLLLHHLVARISWADVWGRVGVEDHPSFREREFAVVGQDYRRPVNLRGRQIRLSSPSWEDATPSIVLLGCPPCRSRSMPIAVITYPGSGIG